MIADIRFVSVLGRTILQVKKCHLQTDASGAFCGLIDLPWESVPTVHFDSIDAFRQAERDDRSECANSLAYHDLAASGGIVDAS